MTLLVLGLALWVLAHGFRRLAPNMRTSLGARAAGPIALLIMFSVLLMVLGYRMADHNPVWSPPWIFIGVNNVLMFLAVYLFAVSGAQARLSRRIRHPMLMGMIVWGIAHLMVNGSAPDLVLFGGLICWAIVQIVLINRSSTWVIPEAKSARRELGVALAACLVFVGIIGIHSLLGPNPVWGGWIEMSQGFVRVAGTARAV